MHNHHHFFYFFANKELNELYASIALRSFALSMIGIFIPIYLLTLGYALEQVYLLYIVAYAAHAILAIPAGYFSSRFGFKHAILASILPSILFYYLLYSLPKYEWSLILLGILFGGYNALFWVGYHADFSKSSKKKKRGSEIGTSMIIQSLVTASGPFIGGMIIVYGNFQILLFTVSIIFLLSGLPLLLTKDVHEKNKFQISKIFKDKSIRETIGMIAKGTEGSVAFLIWPIFIYSVIFVNGAKELGFVTSLTLIASFLATYIVGKQTDKKERAVLHTGSILNTIIWSVRTVVTTVVFVTLSNIFYGFSRMMIIIPFDSKSYSNAVKKNITEYTVFREFTINLGGIFTITLLYLIGNLARGLIVGSISSLLLILFI